MMRIFAPLLLLLQLSLPYAQAHAAWKGIDLAQFVCHPSDQSLSSDAKTALSELLEVLDPDEGDTPAHDCERCVTAHSALPAVTDVMIGPIDYRRASHSPKPKSLVEDHAPRGPPCGRRAPPSFV